jgi:hypothetical protein
VTHSMKRRTLTLNAEFQDIEQPRQRIFGLLGETGTLDALRLEQRKITGNRNGALISIVHLRITDRKFHELVLPARDNPNQVLSLRDEVGEKIPRFDDL